MEGTDAPTSMNARPTEADATTTPIAPTRRVPENALVTPVSKETASDPPDVWIFTNAKSETADVTERPLARTSKARANARATPVMPATALVWTDAPTSMNARRIMETAILSN